MQLKNLKKWEVRHRLEFIESRLYWEGRLNRGDLVDFFGISILQASKDIAQYQEVAPGNMDYDTKLRKYSTSKGFQPRIIHPDADGYLAQLQVLSLKDKLPPSGFNGRIPEFNIIPTPGRKVDEGTLKIVLQAIREQNELRIYYQSMTRPKPIWRWVAPHALSFDGLRWHIRAYCQETISFRDFLLSRILTIEGSRMGTINPGDDHDWHTYETVRIAPHPGLSNSQKRIIEHDYGMTDGCLELKVRAASLIYFLKRLGLDQVTSSLKPEEQQIVLLNENLKGQRREISGLPSQGNSR